MIFGSFNVYFEAPDNTIGDRIVLDTARALAHYPECVPGSMRAYRHEISDLTVDLTVDLAVDLYRNPAAP